MTAINGSLWTIKVEVAFYLAVPVLCEIMRPRSKIPLLALLFLLSYAYFATFKFLASSTGHSIYEEIGKQLPGQLRYFALGAAVYYYETPLRKYLGFLGPAAFLVLCFFDMENAWFWKPVLLACVVFAIAFGPFLGNIGRVGDLSYAAYLVHFPVVQIGVSIGLFDASPWLALAAVVVVVTLVAFLSWHFIEKPFLSKSSHYVRAETGIT